MPDTNSAPFNLDAFVKTLKSLRHETEALARIKDVMDAAFADPVAIRKGMPSFHEDETTLFEDDTISIWHCRFNPGTPIPPHDHQMSAIIGLFAGIERNSFYKNKTEGKISLTGHTDMEPGDILQIAPTAIHSVECLSETPSCGIHVYFGPLTQIDRSLYDTNTDTKLKFTDETFERLMAQS